MTGNRPISVTNVIALVILSVATIVSSHMVDHYEFTGDELLVNNNFQKELESWQEVGHGEAEADVNSHIVRLVSEGKNETVAIRQTLTNIEKGQRVRFAGSIKAQQVGRGDKAWQAARLIFVGVDGSGGSIYSVPHILTALNGSAGWEHFARVFASSSNATNHYIEIQLVNVIGVVWVKDLSVRYVQETNAFKSYRLAAVLSWCILILWILAPHRRALLGSKWNILMMFLAIGVLFAVLMPASSKNDVVEFLQRFLPWIDAESGFFGVGHFLMFSALSVVVFWRVEPCKAEAACFGSLILFAMLTEIVQFLVDGRTPRVSDFFVDFTGVALGLFLSRYFSSDKSRKKEAEQYD